MKARNGSIYRRAFRKETRWGSSMVRILNAAWHTSL
jgi:hypothetical protein